MPLKILGGFVNSKTKVTPVASQTNSIPAEESTDNIEKLESVAEKKDASCTIQNTYYVERLTVKSWEDVLTIFMPRVNSHQDDAVRLHIELDVIEKNWDSWGNPEKFTDWQRREVPKLAEDHWRYHKATLMCLEYLNFIESGDDKYSYSSLKSQPEHLLKVQELFKIIGEPVMLILPEVQPKEFQILLIQLITTEEGAGLRETKIIRFLIKGKKWLKCLRDGRMDVTKIRLEYLIEESRKDIEESKDDRPYINETFLPMEINNIADDLTNTCKEYNRRIWIQDNNILLDNVKIASIARTDLYSEADKKKQSNNASFEKEAHRVLELAVKLFDQALRNLPIRKSNQVYLAK